MNATKFLKECDAAPWNPVTHSSKTKAVMDLVRQWRDEAQADKIISMLGSRPLFFFHEYSDSPPSQPWV